jgi:hypothetical protein
MSCFHGTCDTILTGEGVITMPWSASVTYQRVSGEWLDYMCAENLRPTGAYGDK